MPLSKTQLQIGSFLVFVAVSILVIACSQNLENTNKLRETAQIAQVDTGLLNVPSLIQRNKLIQEILQSNLPIIKLSNLPDDAKQAQDIFIQNPSVQALCKDENGSKLLNEIFSVRKTLPSDYTQNPNCATCYRVELYNYPKNQSYVGVIDINTKQLLVASILENAAPDIPEHLKRIAVDIAIHSTQVKNELGDVPEIKDAQMAYTKTALNNSKCQRSLHLCVAPTFVKGKKALWSIVDLTDLRLVGTRWTNVGDPGPVQISERSLQNDKISTCYCEKETALTKDAWQFKYNLTASDGLRIANVSFKNKKIFKDAKLVDWHVSYSNSDGFGYSDGAGCPEFSLSAVTAWDEPKILELKEAGNIVGFALEQVFKSQGWPAACNYNYVQRYEFYKDGRFRMTAASIGRGCGNDGTYRPVFRIALEGKNNFAEFTNGAYKDWNKEQWSLQTEGTSYSTEGYAYQINGNTNYVIEPSRGQFADKGRGDNAFVYVTKYNPLEGENDLVTIGPCCNTDYKQGPEKFIEPKPEDITNQELVLWYVPQMKNDDTRGKEYCWAEAKIQNGKYTTISYPCFAGPMFIPKN